MQRRPAFRLRRRSTGENRAGIRLVALILALSVVAGSPPVQAQSASTSGTASKRKAARHAAAPRPPDAGGMPAAFRRDTAARFKVESTLDQREFARTQQADAKRDEAIDELKKLIPKAPSSQKHEMIFRLAELYWEKSKFKYFVEMRDFERAYQGWSESGQTGEPPSSQDFVRESELIKRNALRLYEKVLREYPRYERNDEVLFYLGYNAYEAGHKKRAVHHYRALIKRFPRSHLVAEAHLQLGEHFFNDNHVRKAKKAYARALAAPTGGRIYNYALYKLAWCDYNVQAYAAGIKKLKEVITRSDDESDRKSIQLKAEALGDLARFFSYVDESDSAFAYFMAKGGEDLAIQYTSRLGALYSEQGKWPLEIQTYRLLIKKYPMHERSPYLQALIVDAYSKMGRKGSVRREVERLVDLYRPRTPWYRAQRDRGESGRAALEYAYDLTESKLRDLVTDYHREAQKRRDVTTYELARDIYAKYLEAFSDTESAYAMRFFYAEVLWALKEWKNAADQYRRVATTGPAGDRRHWGKYAQTAAYNQILAWEKIIESGREKGRLDRSRKIFDKKRKGRANTREVKRVRVRRFSRGRTYAEEPIPAHELALSEACDLYFKIADPKDKDLPAIKFKAAYIYYAHNHFVAAAERYFEIVERWPRDGLSKKAANLVLDSLNVQRKWDELAFYAERFRDNRELVGRDKRFKQEVQALLEGAVYLSVQSTEKRAHVLQDEAAKERELAKVATRFAAFQKRFPESEHADKAVYASIMIYDRADELDHAIAAAELLKTRYPDSNLAKENDWLLAEFYERIADFETSAEHFDAFYKTYKKDRRASDALYNAALYLQGLGQNRKSIKRFEAYIQEYHRKKDVPVVYWRVCELHESDGDLRSAALCFDDYRARFRAAAAAKVFESRYRYARLMEKLKRRSVAMKEYTWLVGQYPRLGVKDRNQPGVQRAAAHAAFELLEPEYEAYVKMRVTLDKRKLKAKLDKAEVLACVDAGGRTCGKQGKYLGILEYGNGDYGICALTRMGQVYREVANSIRGAPLPRRLTEDQIEIYKAELDTVALGPEEKGIQAFERALAKAYELNIYNGCTLTAQSNLKELNPHKFPDLQKRRFQGAEGFITAGAKLGNRPPAAATARDPDAKAQRPLDDPATGMAGLSPAHPATAATDER